MAEYIKLYEKDTDIKRVMEVVEILRTGGIIIYPTDTVYSLGCDIMNSKAVEKVARIKGIKVEQSNFSFICHDLSHLSDYSKPIPNPVFKLMKRNLPGPFTFILPANNNVPRYFKKKKKTVGIRVPNNAIIRQIVEELGNPIFSTSVHSKDEVKAFMTNPELIYEEYDTIVDAVIDGGIGGNQASTIIDCSDDDISIVREGKGEVI